ncbi:MAG: class I SAM-dependent methyltransferase [Candidatus Woesearchaeota archaeon]
MKYIKLKGKEIEAILTIVKEYDLLNKPYKTKKEHDVLYIPLIDAIPESALQKLKTKSIEIYTTENDTNSNDTSKETITFEKILKTNFKEAVLKLLSEEESNMLKTAYDVVGTIAILEIDEPLYHKANQIAEVLLTTNKNITTVVRKKGKHDGTLRIQEYEILAGEKTLTTIHQENNTRLKITIDKVYYSPRSATERKRVFSQVKEGEDVLIMFSGCGPFTCTIAKNTNAGSVVGIELNEVGHTLAVENIKLNKLKHVTEIQGDVREICPALQKEGKIFDRIIMPLPKTAEEFLPEAFMLSKKGTIIHLYDFKDEKEFPKATVDQIDKYAKKHEIDYEILECVKCGQFSPSVYRVCVDFKVL